MKKTKSVISLILCLLISLSTLTVFAENYITLYAEDGRAKAFPASQVDAQLTVGWYKEPVQRLYTLDGRSKVFGKSQVDAQLTVGWYKEPVQMLYAPGKSKVFKKSEVAAQLTVGWYTYPVTMMWALDDRTKVVPTSQVAANQKVGWYTADDYLLAKADYLRDTAGYAAATSWLEKVVKSFEKDNFEFKPASDKLDAFCLNWYAKNNWIPVAVYQSYVSNDNGKPQINFSLRNLSKKDIDAIQIKFTCYDANGNPTADGNSPATIEAPYITYSETIGSSRSIEVYMTLDSNTKTKKVGNVQVTKIIFEDGSTWSR